MSHALKTIGKYQVRGKLGSGGMGGVYKAEVPGLGRLVAIKVLEPAEILEDIIGMNELERRFTAEARTMAGLNHPHVAQVWDMGRDDNGRLYFVMEYLCNNVGLAIGETFRAEDVTRVIPLERAVKYAAQTLDALARLHYAGIVHRDVKPYNLLLTDEDSVKLIDFGLATARGENANGVRGERVGSPYYASPEQEADPAAADERADVFSVGVMLYRMLTGRLPEPGRRAGEYNPDLNEDWDEFFGKALAYEPSGRFASARAMRNALDALYFEWLENIEAACSLADIQPPGEVAGPDAGAVRAEPMTIAGESARDAFGLDELWRPRFYCACNFKEMGDGAVSDTTNGLVWERAGSPYPLSMAEAGDYLHELNNQRLGGRSGWRLPTAAELKLLLRPVRHREEHCMDPIFDTTQKRIWTSDLDGQGRGWYADADLGFMAGQDTACRLYVRAVCGG
jgi:serine/threonine-protein kinase